MNQFKYLFIFMITLGLLSGCIPEPNFPNSPNIKFLSVTKKSFPDQFIDSVYVSILIEDGDGDLGLSSFDTDPKYAPTTITSSGDTIPNKYVNNYFITIKKNVNGSFQEVTFPGGTSFNGRFPILQEGRGALEVKLNYGVALFLGVLQSPVGSGDEIIFDVQIADRALNESNMITTDPVVLGQ